MRYFLRLLLTVLVLGAIFGGIFYYKQQQNERMAQRQSAPPPPAVVAAASVETERWQPAIRSVGSLEAINGVAVTTEVAGLVRSFEFESGQRVSAGQVLVYLEDSVDRAALQALIADRELARTQFERASELLARGGTSQSDFDQTRFRHASAEARVQEQQTRVAKTVIRAPFDGLLGLRLADLGQYLSPGDPIVQLQALHPIYVDYAAPEHEFRNLSVGQSVAVRVTAYPEQEFMGTVSAIDSGIATGTRSVSVRATLDNPEGALRPGMFAEVRTLRAEMREVLTVPRTAISFNTYGDFVFVIEQADADTLKVTRRQVSTGAVQDGRIEVRDGLAAGDRVVRAGLQKLRNDQAVRVDDPVELDDAKVNRP